MSPRPSGTGINTGEVVTGDRTGGQFYASGDAVNVAARLEAIPVEFAGTTGWGTSSWTRLTT